MSNKLTAIIVGVLLFAIFPNASFAKEAVSVSISPLVIRVSAKPKATITTPISITNHSSSTVTLRPMLRSFTASSDDFGKIEYLADGTPYPGPNPSFFEYVTILDENNAFEALTLAPKQEKTLTLKIAIPSQEKASDYYFSIVFISETPEVTEETEPSNQITAYSLVSSGIASHVLLTIEPKSEASGTLMEFSTPFLISKGPVPFKITLKNTSNNIILPQGDIIMRNVFGQAVGKVKIDSTTILANSARTFTSSGNEKSVIWPESFLLGPYSATLTLTLSEEGPIIAKKIRFISVPVQYPVILLTAIIILVFIRTRLKLYTR